MVPLVSTPTEADRNVGGKKGISGKHWHENTLIICNQPVEVL